MQRPIRSLSVLLNRIPRYALSLIGFVTILSLCWLPASTVQQPQWFHIPNADKVVHFTLFFVWAFCLHRDTRTQIKSIYKLALLVLLAGLFTAVLTEWLQPIVSNRMRDWEDGLADVAGTLASTGLFLLFTKKSLS